MEERIRQVMEYMQMKQKDFAAKIGISEASLSGVFNGRTRANNRHIEGIHKAFPQINLNWLMFGTGDMLTSQQIEQSPTLSENAETNEESIHTANTPYNPSDITESNQSLFASTPSIAPQSTISSTPSGSLSNELMQELIYLRELKNKNLLDKKVRKVLEIRVFFDDGTYESFSPSSK